MPIDVIVNPKAAQHSARPSLIDGIRRACDGVAEVHRTECLADLDAVALRLSQRGSDLIILSGGDGTLMEGLTAITRHFGEGSLPPIGLLPCGTVSTVARNWGVDGQPLALLRRMLDARSGLPTRVFPTLRAVATSAGEAQERIGFIFGTGLIARFFETYYRGQGRGAVPALGIVARVFYESFWGGPYARQILDPLPCLIEVDGTTLEPRAWSLVCAAVVRDLGLHMCVTYRAGEDPQRPHLVASALPPHALGPRAPWVIAGRNIGGAGQFDDLAREFTVTFGDGLRLPSADASQGPYVLDGDVFWATSVTVSAGPRIRVAAV